MIEACFYPRLWLIFTQSPVLSKPHTLPESPLTIAKTSEACFYPPKPVLSTTLPYFYPKPGPHQKRPYTKGLLPHPPRIAASITKTSKACFYPQPVLPTKLVLSTQSPLYPQLVLPTNPVLSTQSPFLSMTLACFIHLKPVLPTKLVLSTQSPLYPLSLVLATKAHDGSQPIFPFPLPLPRQQIPAINFFCIALIAIDVIRTRDGFTVSSAI